MTLLNLTLNVPEPLYRRLKERAERTKRSMEEETLEVLASAVTTAEQLPIDLEEAIAPLSLLDDPALWRAARSGLAKGAGRRLEELHLKRQREGLTAAETQESDGLVKRYERAMLVRARAAAILRERGHDVSSLAARP